MSLWSLIAGLVVTLMLGYGAGPVRTRAKRSMAEGLPEGVSELYRSQWAVLTKEDDGGATIGWIERFMFFAAFLTNGGGVIVVAWLAFKVASKWNAWTNLTAVPTE